MRAVTRAISLSFLGPSGIALARSSASAAKSAIRNSRSSAFRFGIRLNASAARLTPHVTSTAVETRPTLKTPFCAPDMGLAAGWGGGDEGSTTAAYAARGGGPDVPNARASRSALNRANAAADADASDVSSPSSSRPVASPPSSASVHASSYSSSSNVVSSSSSSPSSSAAAAARVPRRLIPRRARDGTDAARRAGRRRSPRRAGRTTPCATRADSDSIALRCPPKCPQPREILRVDGLYKCYS